MGMGFALTWLRQVSPPASQNHFNHWTTLLSYAIENSHFTCARVRAFVARNVRRMTSHGQVTAWHHHITINSSQNGTVNRLFDDKHEQDWSWSQFTGWELCSSDGFNERGHTHTSTHTHRHHTVQPTTHTHTHTYTRSLVMGMIR